MLPHLKHLDLMECHEITRVAVAAFGKSCPSLTHFAYDPLNDRECLAIVRHMPNLTSLDVHDIWSDTALHKFLVTVLKHCTKLEHLSILTADYADLHATQLLDQTVIRAKLVRFLCKKYREIQEANP